MYTFWEKISSPESSVLQRIHLIPIVELSLMRLIDSTGVSLFHSFHSFLSCFSSYNLFLYPHGRTRYAVYSSPL